MRRNTRFVCSSWVPGTDEDPGPSASVYLPSPNSELSDSTSDSKLSTCSSPYWIRPWWSATSTSARCSSSSRNKFWLSLGKTKEFQMGPWLLGFNNYAEVQLKHFHQQNHQLDIRNFKVMHIFFYWNYIQKRRIESPRTDLCITDRWFLAKNRDKFPRTAIQCF